MVALTLEDVSLLKTESVATCEESEAGVAENACCYRHLEVYNVRDEFKIKTS